MSVRFQFVITGVKPLLMHADNVEWADTLKAWQTDPANRDISKAGDDRSPAWTWLGCLPPAPVAAVPGSYLAAAVRDAGKTYKIGKGNKTYKEAAASAVYFDGEFFPIQINGKTVPWDKLRDKLLSEAAYPEHLAAVRKHGFDLDMRRARIGQSKHVRVRPRFNVWSLAGVVELTDPDALPADVLARLFEIAGKRGIGDYRPGSKAPGPFGQFVAELTPAKS